MNFAMTGPMMNMRRSALRRLRHLGATMKVSAESPHQQGPQNRLSQVADAAAPSRGSESRAAGSVGANSPPRFRKQGPRDWLRQTAGAAAPSGGSAVHAVTSVEAL